MTRINECTVTVRDATAPGRAWIVEQWNGRCWHTVAVVDNLDDARALAYVRNLDAVVSGSRDSGVVLFARSKA